MYLVIHQKHSLNISQHLLKNTKFCCYKHGWNSSLLLGSRLPWVLCHHHHLLLHVLVI